jgi:hypothetical protein
MDTCSVCGEALTIVGRVMTRQGSQIKSQRLEQARSHANLIKDVERVSSDKRMAGFVEIDRRRLEYEREAQKLQEYKDRQLFRGLALGLGIFLLLIAVVTLVIIL